MTKSKFIYSVEKLDQIIENTNYKELNKKLITEFLVGMQYKEMNNYLHGLGKNNNINFEQNVCLLLVTNFLNVLEYLDNEDLKDIAKDMIENNIHILITLHSILYCINILISKKNPSIFSFKRNSEKVLKLLEMYTFINTGKFELIIQTFDISPNYLKWLVNAENLYFDFNKSVEHKNTLIYIKDIEFKFPIKILWMIPMDFTYLNTFIKNNTILECELIQLTKVNEYEHLNTLLDSKDLDSLIDSISVFDFEINMDIEDDILKDIVEKLQNLPNLKHVIIHEEYDSDVREMRSENIYEIFRVLQDQKADLILDIYETPSSEYSIGY
ncbi:MAG: hypothetical protein ACRCXT_06150 [Paraclostridium sp.]